MKYILILALSFSTTVLKAQQFLDKGMIEYQVVINNHKAMGEGSWAEMFKDKIPRLSTSYYQLIFNGDNSIYKFDRKEEKTRSPWGNDGEDNIWFNDFSNEKSVMQKSIFGDTYLLTDSTKNMDWKITNESRIIAGFNCRKAVAVLFDSVYVFAFYTDEILVSGGPMSLGGLPGMIMGITIPRMYCSWVATKVAITGVNFSTINAPVKGKKKAASELKETVVNATKDWGSYGQQAVWNIFL